MTAGTCSNCYQPLNETQWDATDRWKSCPRCSERNGSEHVFYDPKMFGETPARATSERPNGPQSHCASCRSRGQAPAAEAHLCSKVLDRFRVG